MRAPALPPAPRRDLVLYADRRADWRRRAAVVLCGLMAALGAQQAVSALGDESALAGEPGDTATPTRKLTQALALARQAAKVEGPQRKQLAAEALALLAPLQTARPWWGEAGAVEAYARTLHGDPEGEVVVALARSYADTPYLRESGLWRWGAALDHWQALDPETRRRAIDEAVWLTRLDPSLPDRVMAPVRGTPAYRPLLARLLQQRVGDTGFSPLSAAPGQP